MNSTFFSLLMGVLIFIQPASHVFQPQTPTVHAVSSPDLVEKLNGAVKNRLIRPLQAKSGQKDARVFSRCPSGYMADFDNVDYNQDGMSITAAEDGLYYGKVAYYSGCDGNTICEYRVDGITLQVEARSNKEEDFIPAQLWVKAHDKVQGDAL